jgi:hypothetical protein
MMNASRFSRAFAASALGLTLLGLGGAIASPVLANDADDFLLLDLTRARNLARQAVERANGGLGQYRAERSMHGFSADTPHTINPDGGWTFVFRGFDPRSLVDGQAITYTMESQVTVSPTGQVTIDYNGPLRAGTARTGESPLTNSDVVADFRVSLDLNRAKNLARQAAERANGGLGLYRAERSMHQDGASAPHVVNPDGSWTFTFRGFDPRMADASGVAPFTVESVVTVTPAGVVTMDYNGPIR